MQYDVADPKLGGLSPGSYVTAGTQYEWTANYTENSWHYEYTHVVVKLSYYFQSAHVDGQDVELYRYPTTGQHGPAIHPGSGANSGNVTLASSFDYDEVVLSCYGENEEDSWFVYEHEAWYQIAPIFTPPGAPSVSQNGYTVTLSWSATTSNVGTPNYNVYFGPNGQYVIDVQTSRSATINLTGTYASLIGTTVPFYIEAYSSDHDHYATGGTTNKYIGQPLLSAPSLTIGGSSSSYTGGTLPLVWTASTASYASGTITYSLYINGVLKASNITSPKEYLKTDTSIGIESLSNASIVIRATLSSLTRDSNTVKYTYKEPYTTLSYYINGSWSKCRVWYYTGGEWKPCNTYYYTGGNWVKCSTS